MTDDDNATRVGTDDDTATLVVDSETIIKRGADHVKARAHEPVRQNAEILAWLTKIESPAKTALFDPSSRFPTVITVNPILFMKSGLEKERLRLIQDLENDFGIQLNSRAGVTAERLRHQDAPINVLNEVQPQDFTLPILRGLRAAAGHFEQILGKRRAGSARRGVAQEIKTVGAVTWALAGSQISPTVLGRYFEQSRLFNLYISAPRTSINVNGTASEVSDDIQYRATHELAHGLLGYAQSHFTDRLWGDQEPPPVINGRTTENPERDFEFSIQAYFFDTELLASRWPRRYAFVNKLEAKYPQILDIDKKRGSSPGILTKEIIEELPPHEISNFMRQVGSWTEDGKRYFSWKEQPVTPYGRTNPAEDFAETAVAYFMNNGLLRGEAPHRAMFLDEIISGWSRKRPVDTVAVRGTFSSLRAVVLRGRSQSGNVNTLGRIPGSDIVQDFELDGDIITIGDTAAGLLASRASNVYTPFEEFFQNEAVRRGMSPSELETRMYAPGPVLVGIGLERPRALLSEVYGELAAQGMPGVCGETSKRLLSITSVSTAREVRGLDGLFEELARPGNVNLRVLTLGHSFFAEKRGGMLRVLQSYVGNFSLVDDFGRGMRISVEEFSGKLRDIVSAYHGEVAAGRPVGSFVHSAEVELFGGKLFSVKDFGAGGGLDHTLQVEVATDLRDAGGQRQALDELLNANVDGVRLADAWDGVQRSSEPVHRWMFRNVGWSPLELDSDVELLDPVAGVGGVDSVDPLISAEDLVSGSGDGGVPSRAAV
ncbi:hypothetical protein, partial [Actinacidiphila glaucinigra]|uniref:hypothetical protein n=1 Tax=Actinacidiphila glaucinigra TaxID=235986 RepID=UPI0035D9F22B